MKTAQIIPIALSVFLPGCGHIAAGRPGRGILVFFLFGFAIDGYLYSQAMSIVPADQAGSASTIHALSIVGGLLLWAYAVADTTRLGLRHRRIEARADDATGQLREGLVAYLRDDLHAAVLAYQGALRINDQDPDSLFHVGVAYAHLGQRKKARRALSRCIQYDNDGKWDDEAAEQLRHIEAVPDGAAAPNPTAEGMHSEAEA
ncbi:hypothetical protein HQ560_05185 [bacterium]|nr:hypothetical protein [bacterium]